MFEKVNPAHPDKVADRIAGAVVDIAYDTQIDPRVAVEVLIGHGICHIIAETSAAINRDKVTAAVQRIAGNLEVDLVIVPQDAHLARNQEDAIRCGDNGIFKGVPMTDEQKHLSCIARGIYEKYPFDGKYILDGEKLTICQSRTVSDTLRFQYLYVTPGVATAKNGASIVKYAATCNGVTYSNTTGAALNLYGVAKSGTVDVVVTATDSRGYTVSNSQQITVIPYAKPKVSEISLRRTNDIEAEMQLIFNGSISPITVNGTQKNSLLYVQYRYKLTSASSYGSYTSILANVTQSGTSFSYSNLELCSLDANSSYDFHVYIRDQLNTLSATSLYFTVPQGTPLLALRKKMVGINTPTPDSALHVVGDGHFEGDVNIEGDVRIAGTLTPDNIDYTFDKPYFGICETAAATAAKVVTCDEFQLKKGAHLAVQFTYANTASSPSMNVNGTGAIAICGVSGYYVSANMWAANQMVHFVYNGTWWIALNCLPASTARYGITMLSNSVSSTSQSLAATPYAVKLAYDRSSWDSISLTNALAIAYGGTGATTAAAARTNLGITCTSLYSGTLTTGSTTFNYGSYKAYVIIGQPNSTSARVSLFIPKGQLTTTATTYQLADETNYYTFNLSYSGSTVTLAYKGRSGSGQVLRVFGVN